MRNKRLRSITAFFILLLAILSVPLVQALQRSSIHPAKKAFPDYAPLKRELYSYTSGLTGMYAVYFKDLASGKEFGINENVPLPPASSIKLPVVLYLYRQVASGNLSWEDRVQYRAASDYQNGAGILQFWAKDGDRFSLRTLATISIVISDNIAHNMLVRHLGYGNVMNFIKRIGPNTTRPFGSAATTARDMGAFVEETARFAMENPKVGGRLINDLAHTIYHVGLPGKIPAHLIVAHKEGSINGVATDVGIVLAHRPYILAILSKGITDEDTGFKNIAEISRIVYEYQQKFPAVKTPNIPSS